MNYTQAEANQIKHYFQERIEKIASSDFTTHQKDKVYAYLMTELESIYDVPCMFPEQWISEAEGNKILLELYRNIGNLRAFEDETTSCDNNAVHNVMIVCIPDSFYPLTIASDDICQTAKEIIGESFEIVRARKLHEILPNAVFLCADDFAYMKNRNVNVIGSYLYNEHYIIHGTICILKEVLTNTGYDLSGLSDEEASLLQKTFAKLFYI